MANERVTRDIIINYTESNAEVVKDTIKTIDRMIQNRQLNRYWKDQNALINDVTNSYEKYNKTLNKMDATELVKSFNALKALSGIKELDISQLLPNFDKVEGKVKELIKSIDLNEAFGVDAFNSAFKVFDMLKTGGIDLQDFFKRFDLDIDTQNLQKSLRLAEKEIQRVKNELVEKDMKIDSLISGSGFEKQEAELESLRNKLKEVYESAEMTFNSFLYANNIDPYSQDGLYKYFQKIKDGAWTAEQAISEFKAKETHLLQESYNKSGGLFNLQQVQEFEGKLESVLNRVEEISRQMNDIIENGVMTKAMQNLSVDDTISQSQRDLFANVLKDKEALSSIAGVLKKIIDESATLQGVNNKTFDEEQFNRLLILFEKIESNLSSMRAIFADVGDGEEFSPLLNMINKIDQSIKEMSTSVKGIGLNMNIDVGSNKELEAKLQEKTSKALLAYQKLFNQLKNTGAGGSIINQKFFEFDINQFDTMMSKVEGYRKFIENMRNEAKSMFNGKDVLFQDIDKSFLTGASGAYGQITKIFNELKASSDVNPLKNLFGETDLSGVVEQLNRIIEKLGEISTTALEFKNTFKDGFNVSASVEEIEKLTSRVKELENELSKVKISSTSPVKSNISSPIKDTFQGDVKASAESSAPAVKEEAKAMEQVAENAEKASKGKEKFAKANKNVKASADASTGSIEKENSALDEKVWEKNLKVIQEYMDANTKLNNLNAKDKGTGKHASDIARQEKEVEKLRESAIEARAALSSMVNPHEAPIDDWGKWVEVMEKFEQATKGSTESVAKLEDALRSARNAQLSSIDSTINNSQSKLDNFSARKAQSDAYKNSLKGLNEKLERLRTLRASLSNTRAFTDEEQTQIQDLTKSVHEYINAIKNMPAGEKGSDSFSRDKWANRIQEYMDKNTRLTREFREELENLIKILRTGGDSVNIKNILGQFEDAKFRIKEAKLEGKSFFDIFKDKAVYGFAAKLANYYLSFYDFIRYARYAFESIKEFDSALAEMRKVSDESVSSLKALQKASFDLANSVGTTALDLQKSIADWMRVGDTAEEATKHAIDANTLLQVSEFDSIENATSALVSMNQAWKDIDTQHINDVLNILGNNMPIATDELASSLQRSAGTLATLGATIEEAAALTVAGKAICLKIWKHILKNIFNCKVSLKLYATI